ncbi:MAG: sensor histidine kinase [Deltaproteobacteria bacterium]|nr:sensor histidine kinase [Deltaproteobacteria bacterium]
MRRVRQTAYLASAFLLTPAVVLSVVGILVLYYRRENFDVAFGVLILVFCVELLAGAAWLVVALRRSADLSRLQADFLSKVSHDFRTPLTSIRMFVETLREQRLEDPERRERVLALLGQETERLSAMIDRLLELARLEAGKIKYQLAPTNIAELVRAVAARFEPRLDQPGVQLTIEIAEGLPLVAADAEALQDVVQNLLDNAFKYTGPDKRIAVRVTAAAHRQKRGVQIAVHDNGPGIALHEHRRIFELFYRVDDRLSRATEGSGLGLAFAKHVVSAHGGRIRVDSAPGRGSTFVVELPGLPG